MLHFTKKYNLFTCLLIASVANISAAAEPDKKVEAFEENSTLEKEIATIIPEKIVISNAISWSILLTISSALYWFATWRDNVNGNSAWVESPRTRPAILWFKWFYMLAGSVIGFDKSSWILTKIVLTISIILAPLAIGWIYDQLMNAGALISWLEKYLPSLMGYMNTLFGYINKESIKSNRMKYFLAMIASFSIGVFGFVRTMMANLILYSGGASIPPSFNIFESLICGLVGVIVVPIVFYLPKILIAIPLETLINSILGNNPKEEETKSIKKVKKTKKKKKRKAKNKRSLAII
ncbi:MAG: hypothetical protein AAF335_00600 [Bacteroidota bacterium]